MDSPLEGFLVHKTVLELQQQNIIAALQLSSYAVKSLS